MTWANTGIMWNMSTDGTPTRKGRRPVNFRTTQEAVDALDAMAIAEGLVDEKGEPNRSALIRINEAFAYAKRPFGWRPPGWDPNNP